MTPTSVQHFAASAYPAHLSEWGVIGVAGERLTLGEGFLPYDLNTPLFSDYAHKLRAVWLPPGTQAHYSADGVFDFPVGTIDLEDVLLSSRVRPGTARCCATRTTAATSAAKDSTCAVSG